MASLITALPMGLSSLIQAQVPVTGTWVPTAAGTYSWNTGGNWTSNPAFPGDPTGPTAGVGDVANVSNDITGAQILNLNQTIVLGTLNLGDANNTANATYTIAPNGGSLVFDVATGSAALNKTAGNTQTDTISANVTLNDALTVDVGTGRINLDGIISGGNTLTKNGGGILSLGTAGTNVLTGVTLNAGTIYTNSSNALGTTSTLTLNGGILGAGSSARTFGAGVSVVIGGNVQFGNTAVGANQPQTFAGTVNLNGGTRTLTTDEEAIFTGVVSNGSIIKTGDDFIQFNNAGNTFTDFTLQQGEVRLGGSSNVLGTGTVTLAAAGVRVRSNDGNARALANNNFVVQADAAFGAAGQGTLTLGTAGATTFDLGGGTRVITFDNEVTINSTIQNGGFTKAGGRTVTFSGANTYTGPTTITAGAIRIGSAAAETGLNSTNIVLNGGFLETSAAVTAINRDLGTGVGQIQFAAAASSGFSASGANGTVTLNSGAPLTWGQANFVQTGQSLVFGSVTAANTVTLTNALDLNPTQGVAGGSVRTVTANDTAAGIEGSLGGAVTGDSALVKAGVGALRLASTANTYSGGTFVTAGTLVYDAGNASSSGLETYVVQSPTSAVSQATAGAPTTAFFNTIALNNNAVTYAITATNAGAVDFTAAPATLQPNLYLGAVPGTELTQNGVVTPAQGNYRLGGGGGVLRFDTASDLTGANSVVVRNGGVVLLDNAAQNYTGTTTINGGVYELRGNGSGIASGTGITVNGLGGTLTAPLGYTQSATIFSNIRTGALLLQSRKDAAGAAIGAQVVTLNGGAISTHDNDTAAGNILVQNVTLGNGSNQLASQPQNGGSAALDQFIITNLRRNAGATVDFRSQFGTLGGTGDNGRIFVTNLDDGDGALAPTANVNGIIGGWALASSGGSGTPRDFAAYDAANGVVALAIPTSTQSGTTSFATGSATGVENWLLNNATLANNNRATAANINSLIVERDSAMGGAVTLNSGGLIFRGNNGNQFLSGAGSLTSAYNSGAAGAPNELFLFTTTEGAGYRITDLDIVDNGATAVRLVKGGEGTITIGGNTANTFTGGVTVNQGTVLFDYRSGTGVLPAVNDIVVRAGGTFATGLNSAVPVTVTNNVLLDGGTLRNTNTGGGTNAAVTYNGAVTVNSLPGGSAVIDADTNRIIFGAASTLAGSGSITKIGANTWELQTASTAGFTGNLTLTNGTIEATGAAALPATSNYYISAGNLNLNTTSQAMGSLAGISTASRILASDSAAETLTINQSIDTAYHGSIEGTQLIKNGTGELSLSGVTDNSDASGAPVAGDALTATVNAGTLTLNKASTNAVHGLGSLVTGTALTINGGTAKIGGDYVNAGGGGANVPPAGAPANYVDQIYYENDVVMTGGTLDLNGRSESFDALTGSAGTTVTNSGAAASTLYVGQASHNGVAGATSTFAGVIQNGAAPTATVGLQKLGTGTEVLTGSNLFTGGTTVNGGTLQVGLASAGSLAPAGSVTVNATATLAGTGSVGATTIAAGGAISPGDNGGNLMGLFSINGGLTLAGGSTSNFQLLNNGPGNFDRIVSTGAISVAPSSILNVVLDPAFTASNGQSFKLLDAATGSIAPYAGTTDGSSFMAGIYSFEYVYDGISNTAGNLGDPSAFFLVVSTTVIPEPSRALLLLSGASALLMRRRRR